MNQQRSFLNEAFHVLAQPVMALRATVELGLADAPEILEPERVLGDCLRLIDQLTQDLALLREIASLDEAPVLASCESDRMLYECVEEMAPVAHDCGVLIRVTASKPSLMECDAMMFRRAIFVLLDAIIGTMPRGGEISLSIREDENGVRLEAYPGGLEMLRQKLCWKLMQSAGGSPTQEADGGITVIFPKSTGRQLRAVSLNDEQVLTVH